MRSRTIGLVLFGGFLLVLLLSVMAFTAQHAKADPPASGDWVINNAQQYTDRNFIVNGSLIIQNNGRLTLINTTINMNPAVNGYVQVEKGGTLLVRDQSVIMTWTVKPYAIVAFNNSRIEISNASIYDAGWTFTGNGSSAGIFIDTDNAVIENSMFYRNYYGVIINKRNINVNGCSFINITNVGLLVNKASVSVTFSDFKWTRMGIVVNSGSVQATGVTMTANAYGIYSTNSMISLESAKMMYNYFSMYGKNSTFSVFNSTMWSDSYELNLLNGTKVTFINTTFNDQAMAMDDNMDQVDVWWFVRAHVAWQNGDTIPNANLTVTDDLGTIVFEGNVMSDGTSDVLVLEEYSMISGPSGSQTIYTPHNFTGGINGNNGTTFAGIVKSQTIDVTVYDITMPDLNITYPTGQVDTNKMPMIINGTAFDGESGLDLVEVSAGTGEWLPATLVAGPNGTFAWSFELNMTYDSTYLVEVRAVDNVGNAYTRAFYLTFDTQGPFWVINAPYNNTLTSKANINVTGLIELGGKVTVNGMNTTFNNRTGVWYLVVPLAEGSNRITILAMDRVGNNESVVVFVKRDSVAPILQVGTPSDGFVSNVENVSLSGSTEMTAQITVNGVSIYNNNGQFNTIFTLQPGMNKLVFKATDAAGNVAQMIVNVTYDNVVPYIAVATPLDGTVTNHNNITVRGLTEPGAIVVVGGFAAPNINGVFEWNISLKEGVNFILIKVTDDADNENQVTINVTFDTSPPGLTIDSPTNGIETTSTNVTVKGTVIGATRLWVNGKEVDPSKITGNVYMVVVPLAMGANPIIITAEDSVGNTAQKTLSLTRVSPKTTKPTKAWYDRLFDFSDFMGLFFLLIIIIVIVACIIAGIVAVKAPPSQPSRPRGPPPDDREGPQPYRGRGPPPGRRPMPPPRRPGYEGGPPPRRPGYPARPSGPAYAGPAYSPEPEPPAPAPQPVEPTPVPVYAPQPEPEVEEPVQPPKVVEYEEPTPPPIPAEPEPGIPEIPQEEPVPEHDQLEASIANILTTLDTKPEEAAAPEVVPMSLPVEVKDEAPKTKDVLSDITCPSCHGDVKASWATCPFCDYNLKGGGKPVAKADSSKEPVKEEPMPKPEPKPEPPKERVLPTKAQDGDVKPIDLEPDTKPLKAPAPEPKKEEPKPAPTPPKPQKPGKDEKNLDDILKKLKIN